MENVIYILIKERAGMRYQNLSLVTFKVQTHLFTFSFYSSIPFNVWSFIIVDL